MLTQTTKVRLGLISVASLLVTLVWIQPGHSQGIGGRPPIGPPGGISGGISGRPPGFSGIGGAGISGISGRPPGISGIGGIPDPGFSGIRGIPEPPTMPGMPGNVSGRPPGFSGVGGTGIGGSGITGISGIGPRFITVWSCSNCRRELGRGDFPPSVNVCPHCGVRLIGGGIGSSQIPPPAMPGGIGGVATPPPPPVVAPGFPPVNGNAGGVVMPPPEMNPPAVPPPFMDNAGNLTVPTPTTSSTTKSGSRTATIIGVALGSLLLLGIGVTVVVMAWPKSQKPQRRRARRYDDDY